MSSDYTLKIVVCVLAALMATVVCFYFMYSLVSVELDPDRTESVQISMQIKPAQRSVETRKVRKQPTKIPPTKPPPGKDILPQIPRDKVANADLATLGSLAEPVNQDVVRIEFDPPIKNLVALRVVQPSYPFKAVMKEIEGYVVVQFTVQEDGTVLNPFIVESAPDEIFDAAALRAIQGFRFQPREAGGDVLAAPKVRMRFAFQLESPYPQ